MRGPFLTVAIAFLTLHPVFGGESAEPAPEPAELVEDLSAKSFQKREQAHRELREVGPEAISTLKKAAESEDPEVRERARQLLKEIAAARWAQANARIKQAMRWRHPLKDDPDALAVGTDAVFVARGKDLLALDRKTGKPRWTVADAASTDAPALAATAKSVFSIGADGKLLALRAADGKQRWSRKVAATVLAAATDGVLYADKTHLRCLDAASGEQRWEARFDDTVTHMLRMGPERVSAAFGAGAAALNARTGERLWQRTVEGGSDDAALALHANRVIVRTRKKLASLDAKTGKADWTVDLPAAGIPGVQIQRLQKGARQRLIIRAQGQGQVRLNLGGAGPMASNASGIAAAEGLVVAPAGEGYTALDAKTGKKRWSWKPPPPKADNAAAQRGGIAVGGGRVIINGRVLNLRRLRNLRTARPVIAGGLVLLARNDGLTALDIDTGVQQWTFKTPNGVVVGPVIRDGTAYFGADAPHRQGESIAPAVYAVKLPGAQAK